jgi:cytochrome c5
MSLAGQVFKYGLLPLALCSLLVGCPRPSFNPDAGRNPAMKQLVRGYIAIAVGQSGEAEKNGLYARGIPAKDIYVPGLDVYLKNTQTNDTTSNAKTDLSGRFTLLAKDKGNYQVCWKSSVFGDGCSSKSFAAGTQPEFVSTLYMSVPRKDNLAASFGNVRFADDALPRTLEPYNDIHAFAAVTARDKNKNVIATVPVNSFGEYVLPYLPQKESVELTAEIEGGRGVQEVDPEIYSKNQRLIQMHLTIDNHLPFLNAIVPTDSSGKRVQVAAPGDKVVLKASTRDRDGDTVKITWSIADGDGTLSTNTGNTTEWTVPAKPGRYSVRAIAADGKGGYSRFEVNLPVGVPGVLFSGIVQATDGTKLDGAEVEINGKKQNTDTAGRFMSYVPEGERYVFNIRKKGYGYYSKIYDRSVSGGTWTLVAASVTSFDPTKDIEFQDKRSARNCVGTQASRINWDEGPALKQVWYQDGKGNNIPPPFAETLKKLKQPAAVLPWDKRQKQEGCGPGIAVKIPADSLETDTHTAPVGNVELSLATVDLNTPEQMPGDDGVERSGTNETGWMQSYGAGIVDLRDSTGAHLQLKAGKQAELTIPVDRSQLLAGGTLPATAPLLVYDEVKGIWREDGKLTLDAAKQNYTTKVKHFSAQNTDLVFTNPSCIRVQSTLPTPYDLEITVPLENGAAPKQKVLHVTDAPPHVIYHLPNNRPVTLVAIAPGSGSTPPRSLGVFVVNSGPPQASGFGSPPPPSACSSEVTLSVQTLEPPSSAEFLAGLDTFSASSFTEAEIATAGSLANQLNQATNNYYDHIDPSDLRTNLDGFKTANGFTASSAFHTCGGSVCDNPDDEINTAYANSGDLGFGRDMHCRRSGSSPNYNYACYVSNYGYGGIANVESGTQNNTDDTADAENTVTNTGLVATVAMEYSPIEGDSVGDRVVKFFVYNAAGNRVNNADLDGRGRRPVPQLCMVCHGGAYAGADLDIGTAVPGFADTASVKLGSRFLPFDMHLFTYPASPSKAAQQNAFKRLNQDIVRNIPASAPATDTIVAVVDAMYDGGATTQHEEFVVPTWKQAAQPKTVVQEHFYKRVVGNACRTCHAAQPFATLQFKSAEAFIRDGYLGTAESRVCEQHVMPHARRTHDILWGTYWENSFGAFSPTLIGQFQVFGDEMHMITTAPAGWSGTWTTPSWSGNKCGTFVGAGSTPASFYTDFVHPLWGRNYNSSGNRRCSNCHGELSGSATDTRNNLLSAAGIAGSGHAEILPNNLAGSHLVTLINSGGSPRMPNGCGTPPYRCMNKSAGAYSPVGDPTPASETSEVNRVEYWVTAGTGAEP